MENIKINSLEGLEAGSADIDATKTYSSNKDLFKHTASPFLYQGMCFLDEVLIPKLYPEEK